MDTSLSNQIAEFEPQGGNWLPLEELFQCAFLSAHPQDYYKAIFNLFERFPEDDGDGVFWSAVHCMETVGGYEQDLLRFFRRCPTEMTRAMLSRIHNSGQTTVNGISIDFLLGKKVEF